MADLMQFNQNINDAPKFSRAFINAKMNPDTTNLKKRKQLPGIPDELGLPAPKHKCYETVSVIDSNYATSSLTAMVTEDSEADTSSVLESTQDSNTFPGDTQSTNVSVKVDSGFENVDSYDEASTSWDNTGIRRCLKGETGWDDMNDLEECFSEEYCKEDNGGEISEEEMHEFLSSGVVDTNILTLLSDADTQPVRRKPTIDQEFEEYFSSLML